MSWAWTGAGTHPNLTTQLLHDGAPAGELAFFVPVKYPALVADELCRVLNRYDAEHAPGEGPEFDDYDARREAERDDLPDGAAA